MANITIGGFHIISISLCQRKYIQLSQRVYMPSACIRNYIIKASRRNETIS